MAEYNIESPQARVGRLFLGYSTVPLQRIGVTYTPEEALYEGTLFPELTLPMSMYGKEGYLP